MLQSVLCSQEIDDMIIEKIGSMYFRWWTCSAGLVEEHCCVVAVVVVASGGLDFH